MKQNLLMIKSLVKVSFLQAMSYRLDVLFGLLSSVIWLGVPIIFFKVLYLNVDQIAGWTFNETLLLVGVYTLIDGIMMAFLVSSMPSLEQDIREGTLDNILLKPINPQLYYFCHAIDFTQFLNALLGLAVIVYATWGYQFRLTQILLFIISCLAGSILYYSLWFLWTITTFWFPTNFGRSDLFLSLIQLSRYPSSIYRGAGSILFNFLLPFGMVATPATVVLLHKSMAVLIVQLLVAGVFALLDMLFWKLGISKYDGAGR
ncbi:ABC transporter permease [Lactobacillus xylocopicola]|uniref:ABC transporter permease n=1 Tax=Lactobacillus xylocopicola TaxID=2976676 RepID=A0ABN6SJ92_9LACO|nr:ABC-2 family transporter protein [Lactobacillus xylocopicola]BDR60355.1 ABC transporter permease [Lactobacillus xylocopicola]